MQFCIPFFCYICNVGIIQQQSTVKKVRWFNRLIKRGGAILHPLFFVIFVQSAISWHQFSHTRKTY